MSEMIQEQEARERFTVDNDMKAEWCISKIRNIRKEQRKETEELQRQMKFYQDQIEMIAKQADDDAAFFESMLRGYFASRMDEGFTKATKTQVTYKLPSGVLKLKHPQPTYERNEEEILGWLKQNGGQFIKVKESLDWAELKKTVTVSGENVVNADGEIIPGVKVIESEDVFEVEVK